MSGAGLIVATEINNEIKYVVLKDAFRKNKLDFPKGTVDKNESIEEAAWREAFEEANILKADCVKILKNTYTPICSNNLYLYLVFMESKNLKNLKVTPNPHSGIIEHEEICTKTSKEAEPLLLNYLKGSLFWADFYVEKFIKGDIY